MFGAEVADKAAARKQDAREFRANQREDRKKFLADRADERRRRMEADRKYQLDEAKHGAATAKDRYQRRHGLGEYKKPGAKKPGAPRAEPPSSLAPRRRIGVIQTDLRQRGYKTREEAKRALRQQAPHLFTPEQELLLSAALDLEFNPNGRISANNLRKLRSIGVFVTSTGAYWRGGNRGG